MLTMCYLPCLQPTSHLLSTLPDEAPPDSEARMRQLDLYTQANPEI